MADDTPTPTCRVTYADGTACGKPVLNKSQDVCVACHTWSKRKGGTDPEGRRKIRQRGRDSVLCRVSYADGTLCGKATKSPDRLCRLCADWATRSGKDPEGRKRIRRQSEISGKCPVTYANGEPCPRPVTTPGVGLCVACYAWTRRHPGKNPAGRPRKTTTASTYYVVQNPVSGEVKPGITSTWTTRRYEHRSDGFTELVRHIVRPGRHLRGDELNILGDLHAAGHSPVRGHEYFAENALSDVLRIVDAHFK